MSFNIDKIVSKTDKGFIVSLKDIGLCDVNNSLVKALRNIEPILTYGFNEVSKNVKFELDYIEFRYIGKDNEYMFRWGGRSVLDGKVIGSLPSMGWCSTYDFDVKTVNRLVDSKLHLIYDVFVEAELLLKEVESEHRQDS